MYKIPKGCKDLSGKEYDIFKHVKGIIENEFIRNGGQYLETPVFENKELLLGKYGEEAENKLVYNIEENGGEPLTLRYDLTVPFTRYIIENKIDKMRRYTIDKVYRRDAPNQTAGRFREFYQCDFDILGEDATSMLAEATLLKMACTILERIGITEYKIMINDVRNLKEIVMKKHTIPEQYFKKICSVIDKLDKFTFEELIPEFQAIYTDIDTTNLYKTLEMKYPIHNDTIESYTRLCEIADIWGFKDKLQFTNSLARGLDYYSGFVWEIKWTKGASTIISGGRYDSLLNKSLVGISFGLSRMIALMDIPNKDDWEDGYYVVSLGKVDELVKLRCIEKLRKETAGKVLYSLEKKDKKLVKVINDCIENKIRYIVILAENELKDGNYIMKDLKKQTQIIKKI